MVITLRKALAGFLLVPGGPHEPLPTEPHLPEKIVTRASSLRGYSDKDKTLRFMILPGLEEADVLRKLRDVVVEKRAVPGKLRYEEGLNLVVFRGVFGSGGYDLAVRTVQWNHHILEVECDFESPGDGIRTTAGFTQPAAIIPLKQLPAGKYNARLMVRTLRRSSHGVQVEQASHEAAKFSFKVCV